MEGIDLVLALAIVGLGVGGVVGYHRLAEGLAALSRPALIPPPPPAIAAPNAKPQPPGPPKVTCVLMDADEIEELAVEQRAQRPRVIVRTMPLPWGGSIDRRFEAARVLSDGRWLFREVRG